MSSNTDSNTEQKDLGGLEDRLILAALDGERVGDGPVLPLSAESSGAQETLLEHEILELLGLLPFGLEPIAPRPEVKAQLLSRIAAEPRTGQPHPGQEAVREPAASTAAPHPSFSKKASVADGERTRTAAVWNHPAGVSSWWRLAAVLAFAALGLSIWLLVRNQALHRAEIADLRRDIAAANAQFESRLAETSEQLAAARHEMNQLSLQDNDVVRVLRTLSGRDVPSSLEVCALKPTGRMPEMEEAFGNLIIIRERGMWYLKARHLESPEEGRVFVLWFLSESEEPLERMVLSPDAAFEVEMTHEGIPALMTAAAITLEPSPDSPVPSGPRILYGHSSEIDQI